MTDSAPRSPPLEARTALGAGLVLLLATCVGAAFALKDVELARTLSVGVLSAVTTVVGFYFGSSKSSQAKDETLSAIAKGAGE